MQIDYPDLHQWPRVGNAVLHERKAHQELTGIYMDRIVAREAIENHPGGLHQYVMEYADSRPYRRDPRMQFIVEQGYGWQVQAEYRPNEGYYTVRVCVDCPAELWTLACLKF